MSAYQSISPLLRLLGRLLLLAIVLSAAAVFANPDWTKEEWQKELRDRKLFFAATNHPVIWYREVPSVAARAATDALPPMPMAAVEDEPPAMIALEWDTPITPTNGLPTGFILWYGSPTGAVQLLSTNAGHVEILAEPHTYYVSATNKFGSSALSAGLVYPKPLTNILTFGSSITNWPTLSWTNKATAAVRQFFRVKYEMFPSGTNKASVVFSADANASANTNNWQPFLPWPVISTTNRDIQLFWRELTL